jgi:hypothetical protein
MLSDPIRSPGPYIVEGAVRETIAMPNTSGARPGAAQERFDGCGAHPGAAHERFDSYGA